MLAAFEFIEAIAGSGISGAEVLRAAAERRVDCFAILATHYDIPEKLSYPRAAHLADMAYAPVVPGGATLSERAGLSSGQNGDNALSALDRLANMRSLSANLLGREVLFIAPPFESFLALVNAKRSDQTFSRSICIVPPAAIRSALVALKGDALLDNARQRLARTWPDASAHLELHIGARLLFALGLTTLIALTVFGPEAINAFLFPVFATLLILPSWFRLSAILDAPSRPALSTAAVHNCDCPIYTLLIPLRDESSMVEPLVNAIRQFDYPVLCTCHT